MPFSAQLPKRLLLAKQMLNHGIEHGSRQGEFNRLYSILSLDGAVENFLHTVVVELGGDAKKAERNFSGLLTAADEAVKKETGKSLPLQTEIISFHKVRNDAQHHAIVPDPSTIQKSIFYSSDFIRESFSLCFQVVIDNLHLADAVSDKDLREILVAAEDESKKNYEHSMMAAAYAFALLKSKIGESEGGRRKPRTSVGYRIHDIRNALLFKDGKERAGFELGELLESLVSETEYLTDKIESLSLGANIQEFNYFRKKAPHVLMMMDKSPRWNLTGQKYDENDCRRAFNFVYNLVLAWEGGLPDLK